MKMINKRILVALLAILIVIGTVSAVYALGIIGSESSFNITISSGANVSIQNGWISNSTLTLPCSQSGTLWRCTIASIEQGHNLTTILEVKNTGSVSGELYTVSQALKGQPDGTLIDTYTVSSPLSLGSGQLGNVSVIFEVHPNATVGDQISLNTTVF
jgi:hypothetical protein